MDITEIDKNFAQNVIKENDVEWIDATDARFSLYGIYYDESEERYRRMPSSVAGQISPELDFLSMNTTGGRLRFITNSPYVAIKAVEPNCGIAGQATISNQCGFSLYKNNQFFYCFCPSLTETLVNCKEKVVPSWEKDFNRSTEFVFGEISYLENEGKDSDINLFFPLYGGVSKLYIGIKQGSVIKKAKEYRYEAPIVFYGSSITQGGCASRPGNDYVGLISNLLNCNVENFGFSGNGKGEQVVAEYIAGLKMSAFVLDYDHNAPTVEYLENTHFAFYETVRKKNKDLPIIMITRPTPMTCELHREDMKKRYAVIYNSYLRAKSEGDENVYFLDGRKLIKEDKYLSNTVDGSHPNDIGFYNIAKGLARMLRPILRGKNV